MKREGAVNSARFPRKREGSESKPWILPRGMGYAWWGGQDLEMAVGG